MGTHHERESVQFGMLRKWCCCHYWSSTSCLIGTCWLFTSVDIHFGTQNSSKNRGTSKGVDESLVAAAGTASHHDAKPVWHAASIACGACSILSCGWWYGNRHGLGIYCSCNQMAWIFRYQLRLASRALAFNCIASVVCQCLAWAWVFEHFNRAGVWSCLYYHLPLFNSRVGTPRPWTAAVLAIGIPNAMGTKAMVALRWIGTGA